MSGMAELSGVMGLPNGVCNLHGERINVNGVPRCLRCEKEASQAPILSEKPTDPRFRLAPNANGPDPLKALAQDPGHDAMKGLVPGKVAQEMLAKETFSEKTPAPETYRPLAEKSLEGCIREVLSILNACPMPKDLKQFKAVQKAILVLTKVLNNEA